jgi:hypothetical protein
VARRRAGDATVRADARAAGAAMAEQTVTSMARTDRARRPGTGATHGRGATVAAVAAEFDRVVASRQGQHQNC